LTKQKSLYAVSLSIPKKNGLLILDPGHGGADPGSQGTVRKAVEKDLALDWALRIERLLAHSSWQVVLTRRNDRDVPLLDRVAFSEAHRGDLFISLHFNSMPSNPNGKAPDESGIETYCLTPAGAPSNVTRNFEDDIRRSYPNNQYDAQNLLLACRLQSSLVAATGRRDRGVRRARFMTVVREQRRPAVLVEGGFLSNPAEANLILQPEYRETMARAICDALPN
jgi:N-acetylmuramoyl-L-alanine amidase